MTANLFIRVTPPARTRERPREEEVVAWGERAARARDAASAAAADGGRVLCRVGGAAGRGVVGRGDSGACGDRGARGDTAGGGGLPNGLSSVSHPAPGDRGGVNPSRAAAPS